MKKLLVLIGLLTAAVCIAQKEVNPSKLPSNTLTIDAVLDDWNNQLSFYDKDTKLAYSIANDHENIYLALRLSDQAMQMKVLRAGMVIGIDTTGKQKQSPAINYPVMSSAQMERPSGGRDSRPLLSEMRKKFMEQQQLMNLSGFSMGNGSTPLVASNGVVVQMNWDENEDMIYEIRIPVSTFWKTSISPEDVTKTMALNVSIPAMERPSGGGRPSGSGGGPPSWVISRNQEYFDIMLQEQRLRSRFTLANQP